MKSCLPKFWQTRRRPERTTMNMSTRSVADKDKFVVVVAVDQSECSEYTFKWYVKNLYTTKHQVHIVHAQEDIHTQLFAQPAKLAEMLRDSWDKAKKLGDNYLDWAEKNGIIGAKFESPMGDEAWYEVVKYADTVGASLIVIGSRGQSRVRRTLTGSVSTDVLRHSQVPVLICRAKTD